MVIYILAFTVQWVDITQWGQVTLSSIALFIPLSDLAPLIVTVLPLSHSGSPMAKRKCNGAVLISQYNVEK